MATKIDKVLQVVLRLFRVSRESIGSIITTVDIASAYIRHFLKSKGSNYNSQLKPPNQTILFPLPDRWTNKPSSLSFQAPYLFVMQATYSGVPADKEKAEIIQQAPNKSLANLELMDNLRFTSIADAKTLNNIASIYAQDTIYNRRKEVLLGESIINGENPFLLRRFNGKVREYEIEDSAEIQNNYKNAIRKSFQSETLNQNALKEVGLTAEELRTEIETGNSIYSMLFEHLQELSQGKPIKHQPTILFGNTQIKDTYYLQSPYPIFIQPNNSQTEGWICIGIAYRYGPKDIKVFSPFFQSQPYNVWKLATSQLLQSYFNDFHVRVHLGLMHLTSNQYNVPIYNSLGRLSKFGESRNNLDIFLRDAYTLFNDGLQGVNLTATASLINKIEEYSILNRVFNISQKNALKLMANYSNNLDITRVNPETFVTRNGLTDHEVNTHFQEMKLARKVTKIIEDYIDKLANLLISQSEKELLFSEINRETKNMGVGDNYRQRRHRKQLTKTSDVITLIKNLAFCWCVYHAQTFTTMPYAQYWEFRPTMLRATVPTTPEEWNKLNIQTDVLPHPKIMMSTSQLIGGVSAKDPNYFLIQVMHKKYMQTSMKVTRTSDPKEKQLLENLKKIYLETFDELTHYGKEVEAINHQRQLKGLTPLTWMHPSVLEASLNI